MLFCSLLEMEFSHFVFARLNLLIGLGDGGVSSLFWDSADSWASRSLYISDVSEEIPGLTQVQSTASSIDLEWGEAAQPGNCEIEFYTVSYTYEDCSGPQQGEPCSTWSQCL